MTAESSEKNYFDGTHRVCPPEETMRRITPLLGRLGVTRLADITWLDDTGIPVYQAIRPESYLMAVAQGKGLTPALAKVSAAMEAIEIWHAERLGPGDRVATVAEVADGLGYRIEELSGLRPRNHLNPALRLEWSYARQLIGGARTLVPTEYLRLDGRVTGAWAPPLFVVTSNGLASGNTFTEAVLHGLYEIIERDAVVRTGQAPSPCVLDNATVDARARELIDQMVGSGLQVVVEVLETPVEVPSFRARIIGDAFPEVFLGMGSHLDREVALCRALTEAVQSRVTNISGVRDDMTAETYRRAEAVREGRAAAPNLDRIFADSRRVSYREIPSVRHNSLSEDRRVVAGRVHRVTGRDPLVVDHTRPDVGVPVVRVVCPGLTFDLYLM